MLRTLFIVIFHFPLQLTLCQCEPHRGVFNLSALLHNDNKILKVVLLRKMSLSSSDLFHHVNQKTIIVITVAFLSLKFQISFCFHSDCFRNLHVEANIKKTKVINKQHLFIGSTLDIQDLK